MRRSRRGGRSAAEFASSGEDSFVAVVVTKLTGALLFILLLTMVIMALLPKAVDLGSREETSTEPDATENRAPLRISTPANLPEAIAGRPYLLALAATGGRGPLSWSVKGAMPEWLALDGPAGRIGGTPPSETAEPLAIDFQVSDGSATAVQSIQLRVLPNQTSTPPLLAAIRNHLSLVRWHVWLEQGVGFLIIWLIHLLAMNLLGSIERGNLEADMVDPAGQIAQVSSRRRFAIYRIIIRVATLSTMTALALWLLLTPAIRA